MTASNLGSAEGESQTELLVDEMASRREDVARRGVLDRAVDAVRDRYGAAAVTPAALLEVQEGSGR